MYSKSAATPLRSIMMPMKTNAGIETSAVLRCLAPDARQEVEELDQRENAKGIADQAMQDNAW